MIEETQATARLRRLQEHTLSDIPGMVANRAMSSFTLHEEPLPPQSTEDVRVIVYPQDPFVSEPEIRRMSAADIRPGLINSRVRIRDSEGDAAMPDTDGNYLYWAGTREFDQVNAFYYATFTLRMYERYARRELSWSFPAQRIDVDPHNGVGVNAFYSERDQLLGFYGVERGADIFKAAQSADIVSHETAHAVLDGVRDLHNESFGLGAQAFHESFGDMTAVLVALHDDSLVSRLLEWTNTDLRVNNFIAAIADNMRIVAHADSELQEHVQEHTMYLRNAINKFRAQPFESLPYQATNYDVELARESHNYSRLFTGAFYDILVGVYEMLRKTMPERIAIHRARDMMGSLLMCAVEAGPVGELDYADMARAFLAAASSSARAADQDGIFQLMIDVFDQRGILSRLDADAYLFALKHLPDLRLPKTINSALASARFLEEEALPLLNISLDTDLTPLSAYRNATGSAFLTYFSHERIVLQGAEYRNYSGSHVDAFGGLTLMFDPDGRLRSACHRPVTDIDKAQIGVMTRDLIEQGLIANPIAPDGSVPPSALHMTSKLPRGLWVPVVPTDLPLDQPPVPASPSKLVKFPVIFDAMRRPVSDFFSYLEKWRKRDGRGG